MSIKERMAKLQAASGKSSNDSVAVDQKPVGELMMYGWLGRAGAGIMSSTYNKRACTVPQQSALLIPASHTWFPSDLCVRSASMLQATLPFISHLRAHCCHCMRAWL